MAEVKQRLRQALRSDMSTDSDKSGPGDKPDSPDPRSARILGVHFASSRDYNHQIGKQPSGGTMVNVSDGAKEKLLEYLKTNNSDLAVRVILSNG